MFYTRREALRSSPACLSLRRYYGEVACPGSRRFLGGSPILSLRLPIRRPFARFDKPAEAFDGAFSASECPRRAAIYSRHAARLRQAASITFLPGVMPLISGFVAGARLLPLAAESRAAI